MHVERYKLTNGYKITPSHLNLSISRINEIFKQDTSFSFHYAG